MKVFELIIALSDLPKDAELILFTNYGEANECLETIKGIRLLEEDPNNVDLVEVLYE
jgi:hypothetical protein